jgi:hypothetical protein
MVLRNLFSSPSTGETKVRVTSLPVILAFSRKGRRNNLDMQKFLSSRNHLIRIFQSYLDQSGSSWIFFPFFEDKLIKCDWPETLSRV